MWTGCFRIMKSCHISVLRNKSQFKFTSKLIESVPFIFSTRASTMKVSCCWWQLQKWSNRFASIWAAVTIQIAVRAVTAQTWWRQPRHPKSSNVSTRNEKRCETLDACRRSSQKKNELCYSTMSQKKLTEDRMKARRLRPVLSSQCVDCTVTILAWEELPAVGHKKEQIWTGNQHELEWLRQVLRLFN